MRIRVTRLNATEILHMRQRVRISAGHLTRQRAPERDGDFEQQTGSDGSQLRYREGCLEPSVRGWPDPPQRLPHQRSERVRRVGGRQRGNVGTVLDRLARERRCRPQRRQSDRRRHRVRPRARHGRVTPRDRARARLGGAQGRPPRAISAVERTLDGDGAPLGGAAKRRRHLHHNEVVKGGAAGRLREAGRPKWRPTVSAAAPHAQQARGASERGAAPSQSRVATRMAEPGIASRPPAERGTAERHSAARPLCKAAMAVLCQFEEAANTWARRAACAARDSLCWDASPPSASSAGQAGAACGAPQVRPQADSSCGAPREAGAEWGGAALAVRAARSARRSALRATAADGSGSGAGTAEGVGGRGGGGGEPSQPAASYGGADSGPSGPSHTTDADVEAGVGCGAVVRAPPRHPTRRGGDTRRRPTSALSRS